MKHDFINSPEWQLIVKHLLAQRDDLGQRWRGMNTIEEIKYSAGYAGAIDDFLALPDQVLADDEEKKPEPKEDALRLAGERKRTSFRG